jgi:hypothetical protein
MPLEPMRNQYRAVFDKCNNKTAYEKEDYNIHYAFDL